VNYIYIGLSIRNTVPSRRCRNYNEDVRLPWQSLHASVTICWPLISNTWRCWKQHLHQVWSCQCGKLEINSLVIQRISVFEMYEALYSHLNFWKWRKVHTRFNLSVICCFELDSYKLRDRHLVILTFNLMTFVIKTTSRESVHQMWIFSDLIFGVTRATDSDVIETLICDRLIWELRGNLTWICCVGKLFVSCVLFCSYPC